MIKDEEEFRKKELDVPDAGVDDRHILRMNEENCNIVGRILNCAVEESALTDGKPDAAKMQPICYDPCAHVYRIMGDVVAKAFSCGKEIC